MNFMVCHSLEAYIVGHVVELNNLQLICPKPLLVSVVVGICHEKLSHLTISHHPQMHHIDQFKRFLLLQTSMIFNLSFSMLFLALFG
jgi:hypothetical protein